MNAFKELTAKCVPLTENGILMSNVDTDMIIPKQFLKTTKRAGLSKGLFYELKTKANGELDTNFPLNQVEYQGAGILLAGENFGCGSSREHAPWALLDQGISVVIAPSFADIFYNNCFKNGLLPIVLPIETVNRLHEFSGGHNCMFHIDLEEQTIQLPDGDKIEFDIDTGRKTKLLAGLDEIGESLEYETNISNYEHRRKITMPWLERAS